MELRESLAARLDQLDTERRRIRAALAALEDPRRPTRRRGAVTPAELLMRISEDPGVRGSALALEFGRPIEEIRAVLERLAADGSIARDGLGWAVVQRGVKR